jgi:glutamate-1-semialdehyde aminotransferase
MVILVWCGLSPEVMPLSLVKRSFVKAAPFLERSRRSLAGGVSSPFRAHAPIPLFVHAARRSRFTGVDGNEFIDYARPRRTGW